MGHGISGANRQVLTDRDALALVTTALVVPGGAAEAVPIVTAVPLPAPPGSTSTTVFDINASGVAVGSATVDGTRQAIRWTGLRYTRLPTPAANPGSSAVLVDDGGTIAGTLSVAGNMALVVRGWRPDGTTSDCTVPLGGATGVSALNARGEVLFPTFLGAQRYSASICHTDGTGEATDLPSASDLDDDGRVAGQRTSGSLADGTFAFDPVIRAADGTVTQLPTPAGKSGAALAFGPAGSVVGVLGTAEYVTNPIPHVRFRPEMAVVWQGGQPTQLAPSAVRRADRSAAAGRCRAPVTSSVAASLPRVRPAFLWSKGRMIDLGTLGGTSSSPSAINDRGQVVGTSTTASGATHAFLWSRGRMIDLGAPLGGTSAAVDINDSGQIVGTTQAAGSTDSRAVRRTVVGG